MRCLVHIFYTADQLCDYAGCVDRARDTGEGRQDFGYYDDY